MMHSIKDTEEIQVLLLDKLNIENKKITFILDEDVIEDLTYKSLLSKSLKILTMLQEAGVKVGEEIIIQLEDVKNFALVLWACFLGGFRAVPLPVVKTEEETKRFVQLQQSLTRPYVVIVSKDLENYQKIMRDNNYNSTQIVQIDHFEDFPESKNIFKMTRDDIAVISFSSGSTGQPKGVTLTYKNLLASIDSIINGFSVTESDVFLGWTPLTHILGLVGWHITPILASADQVILTTNLFMEKPQLWIQKANQYRATLLATVNFGLKHFLNHYSVEEFQNCDLSSIRWISIGAENVAVQLCETFLERMKRHNLNQNAIAPNYGMTESCLYATLSNPQNKFTSVYVDRSKLAVNDQIQILSEENSQGILLASVGSCVKNCQIRIWDGEKKLLENMIGYVQLSGDQITSGYYNKPELTNQSFTDDGWINTGDLGFIHQGELYITGRAKDLVVIKGQNYYLHDIERVVAEDEEIEIEKIAACSILDEEEHEEKVILYVEYMGDINKFAQLSLKLHGYIIRKIGIDIVVVPIANIPKTISGKIARYKLAERYQKGEFDLYLQQVDRLIVEELSATLENTQPSSEVEKDLQQIFSSLLECCYGDKIHIHDNFLERGGTSVILMQAAAKLKQLYNFTPLIRKFFEYPTIHQLAHYIQKEMVEKHCDRDNILKYEMDIANLHKPFPLSDVQMAYWAGRENFFELGNISTHFYLEVETRLNLARLNYSIQKMVKRHPMLRAIFLENGTQTILAEVPEFQIEVTDISMLSSEESYKMILQKREEMSHQIFDPGKWPLFSIQAFILSPEINYIFFSYDLLIGDAASLMLMADELLKYYYEPGLEMQPFEFTFRDYILALGDFKKTDLYKRDQAYWLNKLKDFPPAPVLPVQKPLKEIKKPKFKRCSKVIKKQKWEQIKSFAAAQQVTGSALLCTIFAEVLTYWSNQPHIGFCLTVFNRLPFHKDVSRIVGDFTSLLLLDVNFLDKPTLEQKLQHVQEVLLEALDHRHYDGAELLRELAKYNHLGTKAIMPVVFTSIETNGLLESVSELFEFKWGITQTSQVYLDNQVMEVNGDLIVVWDYVEEVFIPGFVEKMFNNFTNLLELCDHPEYGNIGPGKWDLDFIEKYNATEVEIVPSTLHQLFKIQADQNPDSVAVKEETEQITYGELDKKSNQVARFLKSRNIGCGDYIGVYGYRCIETIINLLGVLKSGAAYVPIDVNYPQERIDYILENSECKILLDQDLFEQYNLADYSSEEIENMSSPKDLAYIIYTSGSTGRPKGVVIAHESAANTIIDINHRFGVNSSDNILGISSMCFDLSVYDIFGALASGSTLILIKDIRDSKELLRKITEFNVTIWNSVPAIMNMLVEALQPDYTNDCLRLVLLSGDWIPITLPDRIYKHFTKVEVISLGGATEGSIWSIYYPITQIKESWKSIPYGWPLGNQKIYVLNYEMKLCPVGVIGELYIGGRGVARGYLNDVVKTKNSFIQHPQLGMLYKTGDFGVLHQEGYIEFLGRKDHQVKIKGYRIEIGEIETTLVQYPGVKNVIVIDLQHPTGEKYLCAYIVADVDIPSSDLKDFLLTKLPEYMVPTFFFQLPDLPLTPNGKIDRKGLPAPESTWESVVQAEMPKTDIELKLAEIWCQVLQVPNVSVEDHFFDCGGNSLLAQRLVNQIEKVFCLEMPIRTLFEYSIMGELAEYIEVCSSIINPKDMLLHQISLERSEIWEGIPYPASSAQKRLYIIQQANQESLLYNNPSKFIVEGKLDPTRFKQAFSRLVERHGAFRTYFQIHDNKLMQNIQHEIEFEMPYLEADETEVEELITEFVKSFNLHEPPLFRTMLLKISEFRHLFILDIHHIIVDHMSGYIFLQDLLDLYSNKELPELKLQYIDFAVWQQKYLQSPVVKEQERYWLTVFNNEVPVLNLPTDYPRSARMKYQGDQYYTALPADRVKQLKLVYVKDGVTLYMVLFAAFKILLAKYSQQEDLVVGTVTAGRRDAALDSVVGMFVNTLAIRSFPVAEKSFLKYLHEVEECLIDAYSNQDYQFDLLVEKLKIQRSSNRNPLFDVMFLLQNTEKFEVGNDELLIKMGEYKHRYSKFDMTLEIEEEEELKIKFEYSTELFKAETIKRLAQHYLNIIEEIIENNDICLGKIQMITQQEKEQILYQFSGAEYQTIEDKRIHQIFYEKARLVPEKIALRSETENLTYGQLNARSNSLARLLRAKGVGPEKIVGIIADRSIEMVIGIFATLKAGGAYLPIDPDYPIDRMNYILHDSKPKVLLVHSTLLTVDEINFSGEVIDLKIDTEEWGFEDLTNLNSSNDLAYLIYTSGSTGKPKGVMIEHHNMLNILTALQNEYPFRADDTYLLKTTYTFDVSVTELFGWIMGCGKLAILGKGDEKEPDKILKAIRSFQVTHINFVPSMFNVFLDTLQESDITIINQLKYIFLAGEAVSKGLLDKYKKMKIRVNLENIYGPTEGTIYTTHYSLNNYSNSINIPIGKPFMNVKTYILDRKYNPVPIGVVGELCISGYGVARGYLNRPELTKGKFVPNPFEQSRNMYCTGDLARWDEVGHIEFFGRKDNQVKIRGYRIELEEISNVLSSHESVQQAVILTEKDELTGTNYLTAYVVLNKKILRIDLRKYLESLLPDYMIPTYFIFVTEIPKLSSGKIDKKALSKLSDLEQDSREYIAPNNLLERKLADLWSDLFKIQSVGVDDNFFLLGGDSLKATILVSRILKELHINTNVAEILTYPTIKQLATMLNRKHGHNDIEINILEEREYYPVSSAQKQLFILNQLYGARIRYNMPHVLKVDGDLGVTEVEEIFQILIQRHESLRTGFLFIDEQPVQKIDSEVEFSVQYFNLAGTTLQEIFDDFVRPFDLQTPPLIRVAFLEDDKQKYILIDCHHIVFDGESTKILLNDLVKAADGTLQDCSVQYKDYVEWQSRNFTEDRQKELKEYWLKQFADRIPILQLPLDFPRELNSEHQGAEVQIQLEYGLVKQMMSFAERRQITPFMLLLAAYQILLARYANQEDVIVGIPVSSRSHYAFRNVIGMFVNTLAIRNKPQADKTVDQFITEIKQGLLAGFEHQDYPFETLVNELGIDRNLNRNPLFDTMFVMQSMAEINIQGTSCTIEVLDFPTTVAKFDIVLEVMEMGADWFLKVVYNTGLFYRKTIERFTQHYLKICQDMITQPDQRIENITFLTEEEKHQLLNIFNYPEQALSENENLTLHELFEERVIQNPESIALTFGDKQITYQQLNQKANQLARYLRKHGIKEETVVGLMVERSVEMITGILAVSKAGGAYLPIDPLYPKERIQFILNDANVQQLLTLQKFKDHIEWNHTPICLEDETIYTGDSTNLYLVLNHRNLAYIIYTSGTTGQPKGVMIEHRSIINSITWRRDEYKITSKDKSLLLFSFVFDGFLTALFTPLVSGAEIVLLEEQLARDPVYITRTINNHQITTFICVPSLFSVLLECLAFSHVNSLKRVVLAGEKVSQNLIEKSKELIPEVELSNEYGPTENSVVTTCERNLSSEKKVSIGRPIANTRIYIVDKYLNLLPIGVPGELCISGIGLARGYINLPELTAEKFIPNPFEADARMYKTGDIARWNSSGSLEFIGRADQQVKINGYRIEIGEIEEQLLQHELIKEVCVVEKKVLNGESALCAYIVSKGELKVEDIQAYLLTKLPYYMIPTYYIRLKQIPINHSGKIALNLLPEVDSQIHGVSGSTTEVFVDEIEELIAEVWAEVLNSRAFGRDSNFFMIGGSSITAMKVVLKFALKDIDISVQDIFIYKTIRQLAQKVKGNLKKEQTNVRDLIVLTQKLKNMLSPKRDLGTDLAIPKTVLLTGVTGFLGIHLLDELLSNTDACVYCLVRSQNPQDSRERLDTVMKFYFGDKHSHLLDQRIFIISGDITLKQFGLSVKSYSSLVEKIDTVIHAASLVKHFGEYKKFAKVNVDGTNEVITFAQFAQARLFFVSTASVAGTYTKDEQEIQFTERDYYIGQNFADNVYVKSKFEAEGLVYQAMNNGVRACTLRVGNLTGRFSDGHFQINISENAFYNQIKAIAEVGALSKLLSKQSIDLTPVDLCAKGIVKLVCVKDSSSQIFHLTNSNKIQFADLIKYFSSRQIFIKNINNREFDSYVRSIIEDEYKADHLLHLTPYLNLETEHDRKNIIFDSSWSEGYLKRLNFSWPIIDDQYLEKIINHMVEREFINLQAMIQR